MHTEAVHVVWASAAQSQASAVSSPRVGRTAADDHEHVRAGHLGEGAVRGERQRPVVVEHGARLACHEHDVGARQVAERLVRADGCRAR